jgi:hypothetical protein
MKYLSEVDSTWQSDIPALSSLVGQVSLPVFSFVYRSEGLKSPKKLLAVHRETLRFAQGDMSFRFFIAFAMTSPPCHSCADRNPQGGGESGCMRKGNTVFNTKNQESTHYYEKCEIATPACGGLAMDIG